jgi:hypothetical protein
MEQNRHRLLELWPLFFLLASLEAAVALFMLLRIPSEGGGFSLTRWATIFLLFAMVVLPAIAAFFARRDGSFRKRWLDPESQPKLYKFLTLAIPYFTAGISSFAFWLRWWDPERLLSLFERAWPFLALWTVIGIQSTFWLLLLRFGIRRADFQPGKPALISFTILLLVFGFVSVTGLGLTPDPAYWGEPGVPLQGWQLGLALIGGALFLPLSLLPFIKAYPRRTDVLVGALVWALAAGIWLSVPNEVLKNSFYFPIDPPANMPLPYSDSAYYDYMAHGLLTGVDYVEGGVPTRPLYIVFLTLLHLLFGENYNLIITGQTLVLATFPVVFYALGAKLHSRLAGLVIALLAIFREWANLLVSSATRVSNTKMLLVDMPTLLLILLACLFAIRWLEQKEKRSAFFAGGIFGLLLLLRTQAMFILPLLFVVALLALRAEKRPWLGLLLLFILGVAASITPWLAHNFLRIGKFAFDAPFQYQVLASQYAYTGNLDFSAVDLENKSLGQILVTFALKDPGFVAGFISNHFLATEAGALVALPLIAPFNGLGAPINLYWTSFDGSLEWYNSLLMVGYLAVIAIGLGAAWNRWRWIGLLPLVFNLGYAAANGIGRFSGWRYNLPADWSAYFYFGIGFAEILYWLVGIFGFRILDADDTEETDALGLEQNFARQVLPFAMVFAFVGALPWIAESVNPPPRYSNLDPPSLQSQISKQQTVLSSEEIQAFGNQPEAITLQGRLLYPRTFGGNAGLTSATPWPSYAPRDYPRLGFKLLNRDVREVVFPNKGITIENVHARDVIVLGCQHENYIEARLLVFPNSNLTYLSNLALEPCSQ